MIPPAVAQLIKDFPLGFVATITPEGMPAASPKGTFLALNKTHIAFGHIRSFGTIKNIMNNPSCEVNFIDILKRKGARLRGTAQVLPRASDAYQDLWPRWSESWGALAERIKALVLIEVQEVRTFTTPPYDDGATEAEMVALYQAKFRALYPK